MSVQAISHATSVARNGSDIVAAARALRETIVALRAEAELAGRTPAPIVKSMAEAGLYQMYLPATVGGPQCPPPVALRAIEELSSADGAMGWCASLATVYTLLTPWLHPDVLRTMSGDPADLRVAGSIRPEGRARIVDGGYMLSGKFLFASGIDHARWLACLSVIMDGDRPVMNANKSPKTRVLWLAASHATVLDTWSSLGMCATASHDFLIDDVFVPEEFTSSTDDPAYIEDPLYTPRTILVFAWCGPAANALGIARGAIETLIELAGTEATSGSAALLRDRAPVQAKVGEASAIVASARAYFMSAVDDVWNAVVSGRSDIDREIAHTRLAVTHSIRESVRAVELLFPAAGTAAVFKRNGLEKCLRDIHVGAQHNAGAANHYESAGKVLLGLRPTDPGW
jgi:indole-3-acetate monooxygenase